MTYAVDQKKLSQRQIFFVIVTLDVCELTYSIAPCMASGGQCSNMIKDCEDPTNYAKNSRQFYFCSRGVLLYHGLPDVWPLITDVSGIVTRLDPQQKESTAVSARYSVFLQDTSNPPPFFHDKGAGFFHDNRNGNLLRKLKAIAPNYKNRRIQIFESLSTDPKADHILASGLPDTSNMKLKFDGKLKNIIENGGSFEFVASHDTDVFKEAQVPAPISSTNTIQDTEVNIATPDFPIAATEIQVADTTEYRRPNINLFALTTSGGAIDFTYINQEDKLINNRNFPVVVANLRSLTFDRRRRTVYGIEGTTKDIYKFDPILLTTEVISGNFAPVEQIAYDNVNDRMLGTSSTGLYDVQIENGVSVLIGSHGVGFKIEAIEFDDRNEILYGLNTSIFSRNLNTINTTTGLASSSILVMSKETGVAALAHDWEEDRLFMFIDDAGLEELFEIDVDAPSQTLIFDIELNSLGTYRSLVAISVQDSYVKIIDPSAGDEYLKVNFFDEATNKIHVFRTALFGTTVVDHFSGKLVKQVSVFMNDTDTGIDGDTGINAGEAILRLVNGEVKIPLNRYDIEKLQEQMERWIRLFQVRRIVEDKLSSEVLIRELSTITNSNTFMDEGGKVKTVVVAPDDPTVELQTLDDTDNFLAGPKVNDNKEEEAPVTICHFKPKLPDRFSNKSSRNPDDYEGLELSIDSFISGPDFQNTKTPKRFFSPWIFRRREARTFAERHRKRNEIAARRIIGQVGRKDSDIDVGGLVDVTIDEITDQLGIPLSRNCQVVHKEELKNGPVNIELLETRIDRIIGWIAPSSQVGILFDASTDQQKRYAFMGTGTNPRTPGGTDWRNATLGTPPVDGRYFF